MGEIKPSKGVVRLGKGMEWEDGEGSGRGAEIGCPGSFAERGDDTNEASVPEAVEAKWDSEASLSSWEARQSR